MPHGFQWAEFVPVAPILPELGALGGYFLAWGILTLIVLLVAIGFWFVNHTVGKLPLVGGLFTAAAHKVEQYVSNKLAGPISSLDHQMGQSWHRLANTTEWMGHEIAANAGVLADLANLLANPGSIPAWKKVIGDTNHAVHAVRNSIAGKVHDVTRPIDARITALNRWTHSQIHALRHSIAVTIPGEFAGLRHRTRVVEDALARDWKLLKKHERLLGIGALTGVVAVILSRLGLGWTRCNNVGRVGKNVCGMDPSLLESLLADSLLIAGSLSLVEFAREMVGVTDTAVRPITTFWRAS